MTAYRIRWTPVISQAKEIVESYDTSVTLRQLFYQLVSLQLIDNTEHAYKRLSSLTAKGRRDGTFPDLVDQGRRIREHQTFESTTDALDWLARAYRLDRTQDQDVSLYLGVEKAGLVVLLQSWFGHLGIPVVPLSGYSSQSYVDVVAAHARGKGRPAVLLYGGDFDPSGEDIDRDFIKRSGCWDEVHRVALSVDQVREYRLPVNPGKVTDSRAAGFIERHGELMQVELDALPPADLRAAYQAWIDQYWDVSAYEAVLEREEADWRSLLRIGEAL